MTAAPRPRDPVAELVEAVQRGDLERTKRALAADPSLKSRINDSLPGFHFDGTALLAAVQSGNLHLVDFLLKEGADINQKSRWWAGGFGVLDQEHSPVEFLMERGAVMDAYAAARHGRLDRLRELVAQDPEAARRPGGDGQTPLHVADSVEVARFLLEHGADMDALDLDHESTPAQYLVRRRPDIARFLVMKGCRTDILLVSALGDITKVRRFLDRDPRSIYTTVSSQYFPMQNERAGGHIYIWTIGSNKGPHSVAREGRHADVFKLLMDRTPDTLRLALAAEFADERTVRTSLGADAGIVRRLLDAEKRKLPEAAREENITAVKLMLEAGWPVDTPGDEEGTALHWAAFHGDIAMVNALIAGGAKVDVLEHHHGGTPVSWAWYGSYYGWHTERGDYQGVVEALLKAGAKVPAMEGPVEAGDHIGELLLKRSTGALT